MTPNSGYATIVAVAAVALLTIIVSTAFSGPAMNARHIAALESQQRLQSQLLDALDYVMNAFLQDETPQSDSSSDPVWDVQRTGTPGGYDVELVDLSSAVNINALANHYLTQDSIRIKMESFNGPALIKTHLEKEGPYPTWNAAADVISHTDGFFTIYGYWNPYLTDAESLNAMILARAPNHPSPDVLAKTLLAATQKAGGFHDNDLNEILDDDTYYLSSLLTTQPIINVHFAEDDLLAAILAFPYAQKSLPNRTRSLSNLRAGRLRGEITPDDLVKAVGINRNQEAIFRFLGTVTWFWQIDIIGEELSLQAIIARSPMTDESGQPEFQVISRYFRESES